MNLHPSGQPVERTQISDPQPPEAESLDAAMDALTAFRPPPGRSLGEQAGDVIDNYKLLKLIDVGGMGEVWQAEQQAPVTRRVALKVVKFGMDTRAVVARFETERKALAMMDHPHIAKIFDGGATAGGRPYFVMEYVDGVPITAYVRQANLSLHARLALLVQACEAIQHAHRQGIIHRDLKPNNILVGLVDGKPLLKVIDFGIAKATDSSVVAHTLVTGLGQILGTLGYMSPEQTAIDPSRVDTRSDVYSMGAIMYELVTDVLPFDLKSLAQKGQDEALQVIRDALPRKPSTRLQEKDRLIGRRSRLLGSLFQHELDWVVMKALEKDPDRRYESVSEFGEDIKRLLENRPVRARPDSITYAIRKWVLRHRRAVSAFAAILVAIIATAALFDAMAQADLRKAEEQAWLARLLEATTDEVPEIAREKKTLPPALAESLRKLVREHPVETRNGLHSRLALVAHDGTVAGTLQEHMLVAAPEVLGVIRATLGIDGRRPHLWQILEDDTQAEALRFRAAAALATDAAQDARWEPGALGADVAEWLTLQEPVRPWIPHFLPLAEQLHSTLEDELYHRPFNTIQRNAAIVLASFYQKDIARLVNLTRQASADQMPALVEAFRTQRSAAVVALTDTLEEDYRRVAAEAERDALALEQARAGIALLLLGELTPVMQRLEHPGRDQDPRLRTFLIHRFADYHVDPATIAAFLDPDSSPPGLIRAGLLGLSEYPLTDRRLASLKPLVRALYAEHPDSGVHSAAEWLLGHWHRRQGHPTENTDPDLPKIERQGEPAEGQRWFVNHAGITMVVIPGPVAFLMGTPDREPGTLLHPRNHSKERQHRRAIPRSFALASRPLTFRDYEQQRPGHLAHVREPGNTYDANIAHLHEDTILEGVGFEAALDYCNWLSAREGIPLAQHCYHIPKNQNTLEPKDNFLSLTGYRLATEAEWEYGCRSGTVTSRFYGFSEALLPLYAWYSENAADHSWPPGRLRPNDYGFFDMLGNRMEWVHGYYTDYPERPGGSVVDTEAVVGLVPFPNRKNPHRSIRGGYTGSPASGLRCGARNFGHYSTGITLRLARTLTTPRPN